METILPGALPGSSQAGDPLTGSATLQARTLNILIADDNPTDQLLLRSLLLKQGHQVSCVANGEEAVQQFDALQPDIILLDVLMPLMNGYEAASVIRARCAEAFIPIIFLTSLQETDSLARCLELGDDVLSKPYSNTILQAKIQAFARMIDMHDTVRRQRDEIAQNHRHLLYEQEIAKQVFDRVAHAGCLDAPYIKYSLSPMAMFNGDVALAGYGPSGNLLVLLADFTGHGLHAAIGAMPMAQAFYTLLNKGFGLREILIRINARLHEILPVGIFSCAFMAEIDFKTQTLQCWNGGLPDAVLYRPADQSLTRISSQHLPLGIQSAELFSEHILNYSVSPGDRLLLLTDGIVEATCEEGSMYGEERLYRLIEQNTDPEQLFQSILNSVNTFVGRTAQADDLSLVEVKIVAPESADLPAADTRQADSGDLQEWSFEYDLKPGALRQTDPMPLLRQLVQQVPSLQLQAGQIFTILTELYSNALEHGLLELDSAMKKTPEGFADYYQLRSERLSQLQEGFLKIGFCYLGDSQWGQLEVTVEDSGKGFDYSYWLKRARERRDAQEQQFYGRGIHLLQSLCHSVEYNQQGNRVRVVFIWEQGATAERY